MPPILIGIFLAVLSQVAFAIMDSSIKTLGPDLPLATILFFRNGIMLIFILPIFIRSREIKNSFKRLHLHALRSLSGQIGMVLIFLSLHLLPLSEASVLRSLTPLFIPILAFVWLKEQLTWMLIPCFILAITGSWLMAGVDKIELTWLSLLPITAGIFVAMAMVSIKRMSGIAKGSEIVFYFSLLGVIFALVIGPYTGFKMPNTLQLWLIILMMGIAGFLGQVTITRANISVPASILAPFYYLNAVFGALISHFYWGEILGFYGWVGAGLIIFSGLILTLKDPIIRLFTPKKIV